MPSIVLAPNAVLRTPTKPVRLPTEKLAKIVSEMKQILVSQTDPEGVGLAANQIGLPYSLFIARFTPQKPKGEGGPIYTFINPRVISHSEELQPAEKEKAPLEGCLSLPNYYGVVKRWKLIKLKYQTLPDDQKTQPAGKSDDLTVRNSDSPSSSESSDLTEITETFSGFPAVVIQHELDHLSGKIFVERILEQQGKLYKVAKKDHQGQEIWDEVEI